MGKNFKDSEAEFQFDMKEGETVRREVIRFDVYVNHKVTLKRENGELKCGASDCPSFLDTTFCSDFEYHCLLDGTQLAYFNSYDNPKECFEGNRSKMCTKLYPK